MRNYFVLFSSLLLLLGNSQASEPYRVGLSLGNSFAAYRETTYSPLNMYLNALTFIIDGNIEKGNFLHSLNTGFFMGRSEMANPPVAVLFEDIDLQTGEAFYVAQVPEYYAVRAYLEYALNYRLWGNATFPGYLGGAFRADAYMQFANYPSITALLSLGIHATQKWIVNDENIFALSLGIPVFGYTVRPAYAGADAALLKYSEESPMRIITLGDVVSLHNYWALFCDLKYQHRVNALLSLYNGLGLEFSHINIPRPRIDAMLRLSAGIAFTF